MLGHPASVAVQFFRLDTYGASRVGLLGQRAPVRLDLADDKGYIRAQEGDGHAAVCLAERPGNRRPDWLRTLADRQKMR